MFNQSDSRHHVQVCGDKVEYPGERVEGGGEVERGEVQDPVLRLGRLHLALTIALVGVYRHQ